MIFTKELGQLNFLWVGPLTWENIRTVFRINYNATRAFVQHRRRLFRYHLEIVRLQFPETLVEQLN